MTDRNENKPEMLAHHWAIVKLMDEIWSHPEYKTVLIRQLKNMRVDAQLSGQEHEATVLTAAIEALGGTV